MFESDYLKVQIWQSIKFILNSDIEVLGEDKYQFVKPGSLVLATDYF